MKLLSIASILSLNAIVLAVPGNHWQRRQANITNPSNTTSNGGANVGAQQTGLTTVTSTTVVTNTVNGIVSVNTVAVDVVLSIGVNNAAIPIATTGAVVAPAGAAVPGQVGAQAAAVGIVAAGSTGPNAVPAAIIAGAPVCTCTAPAVIATGIYTVTVVNKVDLGTTTFTTVYPTTTLGLVTVQGGQIIPATPTITYVAAIATDTSIPLQAGQFYQAIQVPSTNGALISVNVVVTVSSTTSVSSGTGAGSGTGANGSNTGAIGSGPFSNSSTTAPVASGFSTTSGSAVPTTSAIIGTAVTGTNTASAVATTTAPTAAPTSGTQVGGLGNTPLYNQAAFINDMVSIHNAYRNRHGGPSVGWNQDLANVALANVVANARAGTFQHTNEMAPGSDPYGENIASQYGQNNPDYLVYLWYNELYTGPYNFANPGFSAATGHFTQLVWKASTEIGCAYTQANDARGTYYLACEYNAPGNVDGQYQANVVMPDNSPRPSAPPTSI